MKQNQGKSDRNQSSSWSNSQDTKIDIRLLYRQVTVTDND